MAAVSAVIGDKTVKARKAHHCCLCEGLIEPGTVYQRWCWIYDGQMSTCTAHLDCMAVARHCWSEWGAYEEECECCLETMHEARDWLTWERVEEITGGAGPHLRQLWCELQEER